MATIFTNAKYKTTNNTCPRYFLLVKDIFGASVYASRFPERCCPGKYDYGVCCCVLSSFFDSTFRFRLSLLVLLSLPRFRCFCRFCHTVTFVAFVAFVAFIAFIAFIAFTAFIASSLHRFIAFMASIPLLTLSLVVVQPPNMALVCHSRRLNAIL